MPRPLDSAQYCSHHTALAHSIVIISLWVSHIHSHVITLAPPLMRTSFSLFSQGFHSLACEMVGKEAVKGNCPEKKKARHGEAKKHHNLEGSGAIRKTKERDGEVREKGGVGLDCKDKEVK